MCNILIIDDNDEKINELIDALKERMTDEFDFHIYPKKGESKKFSDEITLLAKPDKRDSLYNFIKKRWKKILLMCLFLIFILILTKMTSI